MEERRYEYVAGYFSCILMNDPATIEEISLERLLSQKDRTSWTCDSEDGIYQYYFVSNCPDNVREGHFVKIRKQTVLRYLDELDKEKNGEQE